MKMLDNDPVEYLIQKTIVYPMKNSHDSCSVHDLSKFILDDPVRETVDRNLRRFIFFSI